MDGEVRCCARKPVYRQADPTYQYCGDVRRGNVVRCSWGETRLTDCSSPFSYRYFFGGAIGIALELGWLSKGGKSKDVKKRWHEERGDEMDVQPYRSSYNPFAALCIGVTGIAMAAHHQTYLFQVSDFSTRWCGKVDIF